MQEHVPLAPYTTLGVGGSARYFVNATTPEAIKDAVAFANKNNLPWACLGGGSNVLVADDGFAGVVIRVALRGIEVEVDATRVTFTASAGEVFDEVVEQSVKAGWWGLENLSHIPGTMGATPIQNVGAYGVDIAKLITAVTVLDTKEGTTRQFTPTECAFGYRDSFFKTPAGRRYIIMSVTLELSSLPSPRLEYADLAAHFAALPAPTLSDVRAVVIAIRAQKFPDWHTIGTAGSFFKNPIITTDAARVLKETYPELPLHPVGDTHVKCSLGFILDKICGLKGYRSGTVGLYEKQALVLVATRGVTTASEIEKFVQIIASRVAEKTGIVIEREVQSLQN